MAHIGNWWWDVKTGEVEWSEEVYKIFKLESKKFTPHIDSIMKLSAPWPEDNKRNEELIQKATKDHSQGSYEQRFLRPDKSVGYYFSTFQGKYDESGKLVAIIGTVQDITERKKTEEKLRLVNRLYELAQRAANAGVWEWDVKTGELKWTPKMFELFGLDPTKTKASFPAWIGAMHPEDQKRVNSMIEGALKNRSFVDIVFRIVKPDGEIRWINARGQGEYDDNGDTVAMSGLCIDITEQKRVEEALRASEEKFSKTFFQSPDAIAISQADTGRIINLNKGFERIFGYTQEEAVGKKTVELNLWKDPSDRAKFVSILKKEGGVRDFLTVGQAKSGRLYDLELSGALIKMNGKLHLLAVARDVTERKKAEEALKTVIDDLSLIKEKLGVVGTLTRHDVRNKLSIVSGNIHIANELLPPDHKVRKCLERTKPAFDQIGHIFDRARTYERLGVDKPDYIDVKNSCEEALSLVHDLDNIKIVNECEGLTVYADSLLGQLFYNLIDNSLKHGKKVSKIRIHYKESKEGLQLIYEDDGVGVPKSRKKLIFKEGYGKSTGIGLRMIRIMCDLYGWTIQETGKRGKGAQFTIRIPKQTKNGNRTYIISSKQE